MITISKDVWSPLAMKIGKFAVKNAPKIAGYAGIGGFLVAIGLTYKNSADIHEAVEKKDYKAVAKKALPIAAAATASTVAIGYSLKESDKRLAAAVLTSNLLNTKNEDVEKAIKEVVGEKKAKAIEEQITKDKVNEVISNSDESLIENTGHGTQLCLEVDTGRLFYSDVAYIRSAINKLQTRYNSESRVTLADFHYLMDLDTRGLDSYIGWDSYYMNDVDLPYCIVVDSMIAPNDEPIVTITYRNHAVLSNYYGEDNYVRLG